GAAAGTGQVLPPRRPRPGDHDRARRQAGEEQHQGACVGVLGHLFDGQGQTEDPRTRPAVLGGDAQPEQAGIAEDLEDVLGVLAALVDLPGPGLDLVLRKPADGGLQVLEVFGKGEIHGPNLPADAPAGTPPGARWNPFSRWLSGRLAPLAVATAPLPLG